MSDAVVVYVMLTHRRWSQVHRLAQTILRSSPRARVLIAHDARAERFPNEVDDARIDVWSHGRAADWGSWEIVEATLDAFARARRTVDPALICLVSGEDYPIRRLEDWEREALSADSWIGAAEPIEYSPRWGRSRGIGDDRYTRYAYRWQRAPHFLQQGVVPPLAERVVNAAALRLEPALSVRYVTRGRGTYFGVRRVPSPFSAARPCLFGSQWLALRRAELDRLLDIDFAKGSKMRRVYRRSVIPDESAILTPLWWRRPPSSLPAVSHVRVADDGELVVWTLDDLAELRGSGSPFCRKVDPSRSAALLDELDSITAAAPRSPADPPI